MNAVGGIFTALVLVFGGGYAVDRIYVTVRKAAIERIQRGQPHLSDFTNRLTCRQISRDGELVRSSRCPTK